MPGGLCQYSGIINTAVAAITIASRSEVVQIRIYEPIKAEGTWGQGEHTQSSEEAEVHRVMLILFGKKIIWGIMEGGVILWVFYRLAVSLEEWERDKQFERGVNRAKRR